MFIIRKLIGSRAEAVAISFFPGAAYLHTNAQVIKEWLGIAAMLR